MICTAMSLSGAVIITRRITLKARQLTLTGLLRANTAWCEVGRGATSPAAAAVRHEAARHHPINLNKLDFV